MATNRDLLKEAIADAKAVKETAIANAKAALEEAFTPYLKEKLSAKLNEMDEEMYEEADKTMDEMEMEDEAMATEEISLDELLAELDEESDMEENYMEEELYEAKGEEEEMNIEDMSEDDLKHFIEDVIKDMVQAGELEAGHEEMENEEGEEEEESEEMEMGEEEELEEEFDINEILAELELDEYSEKSKDSTPKSKNSIFSKGKDEYVTDVTETRKASFNESLALKKTIETLKSELNEINILNAKLLYTNKIFRNKSLTESQKVKVLTAFDKTTTKKEVELVYETLLESLKVSTTKTPIKESMSSASKVLGGVTSKPIIENDAFSRMRELAFGKNK